MAATTKPGRHMADMQTSDLLELLRQDYPDITFVAGKTFCWSPRNHTIVYKTNVHGTAGFFSLLHEVGHALSAHQRYKLDFELLEIELAAWEQAKTISQTYGIVIDEDHIQDCLDSYRDWLYRRSICPSCTAKSLQHDDTHVYSCFNCHATWSVAPSRFCRPYRKSSRKSGNFVAST